MNTVKFLLQRVVLLAVVVCGMVACSGSDPAPVAGGNTITTLSGTAATSAAIVGQQITIKGANGETVVVPTVAGGKYTIDVSPLTPPYLLRVRNEAGNGYIYSVATAVGTANIHPFTDLIIRSWYKVKGTDVETQFASTLDATKLPTVDGINTIAAVIKNILKTSFENAGVPADFNLMSGSFDANQTGFDKVLDQTKVVIAADSGVEIRAIDAAIDPITGNPSGTGASAILAVTTITAITTPAVVPAPAVPANLAVKQLSIGVNSIPLTWAGSTDVVAGYNIYRAPASGGVMVLIDTSPFPAYSDTGLLAGTLYCYQIEAFDLIGNKSAKSTEFCATTLAAQPVPDTTAPAAPTSLVASAVSQGQINLTWVASTSVEDVVAYDIYRAGVFITTTAGTSYNDTGLAANTPYSYTVKARDAAGNPSVDNNSASATTAAGIPSAPANVQAVAGNQQVTISWSPVSGATSYNVYMGTVSGFSKINVIPDQIQIPSNSFVKTALINSTPYFFAVTAVNASGESIESMRVQATPTANVTLAEIQAQLNVLNGLFATSLPAASDPTLVALFDPNFLDNGRDRATYLIDLTNPNATDTEIGSTQTAQALVVPRDSGAVANDATHQWVSVGCSNCDGKVFNMLAIKDGASGKWLLAGNQRKMEVFAGALAFRETINGTVFMDRFAEFSIFDPANRLTTIGANSVTVSGPGMVNATGSAGSAMLFNGTQTLFISLSECGITATTNCFNYGGLAAGDYTFTVSGSLNNVPFIHTYVETLSGIPPATANLTAAMFPVINAPIPALTSLVPNAIVTASWTFPVDYTPLASFIDASTGIGFLFDVSGANSVTGSSVTSTFTLPPVFESAGAATDSSVCVSARSANGIIFYTCTDGTVPAP